jgi:hypothetical protein
VTFEADPETRQLLAVPARRVAPVYEYESTQYFEDGYVELWPNSYVINGYKQDLKTKDHEKAHKMLGILLDNVGDPVPRSEIVKHPEFYPGHSHKNKQNYAAQAAETLKQQFEGTGMFHYGVYAKVALQGIGVLPEVFERYTPRAPRLWTPKTEPIASETIVSEPAITETTENRYDKEKWEPYLGVTLTRQELEIMGFLYNKKSNIIEMSEIIQQATKEILSVSQVRKIINSINQKAIASGLQTELHIFPSTESGENNRIVFITQITINGH